MYSPEMMKYLISYQKIEETKKPKKAKYFTLPKLFAFALPVFNKTKQ